MAAISLTFCYAFPWMKTFESLLKNSTKICSLGSNWQYGSIDSDYGLAPTSRQAVIWTAVDIFYWPIHASLSLNQSTISKLRAVNKGRGVISLSSSIKMGTIKPPPNAVASITQYIKVISVFRYCITCITLGASQMNQLCIYKKPLLLDNTLVYSRWKQLMVNGG